MSDGSKGDDRRSSFHVKLKLAERRFLDYMVFKYRSRDAATALRTCLRMMAEYLRYDLENDKPVVPLVPPVHMNAKGEGV